MYKNLEPRSSCRQDAGHGLHEYTALYYVCDSWGVSMFTKLLDKSL